MTAIENETAHKNTEIDGLNKQKEELSGQLAVYGSKQEEAQRVHEEILAEIERITAEIENRQNSIFEILNEKSTINADNQKYKTMLEQLNIRKAELSSRIIRGKSERKCAGFGNPHTDRTAGYSQWSDKEADGTDWTG